MELPFMISDGIEDRQSFRHRAQKPLRVPIVTAVPVYQVPRNQDRVTAAEFLQQIIKGTTV